MLRSERVCFWIPYRYNAMNLHDILNSNRFEMIKNWVYKNMDDFTLRNLGDYLDCNQVHCNPLSRTVTQDNSHMVEHVSNLGWRAIREAISGNHDENSND